MPDDPISLDDRKIRVDPAELRSTLESMARVGWIMQSVVYEEDEIVITFTSRKTGVA